MDKDKAKEQLNCLYAGCVITDAEQEYIANDVLVIKEVLEIIDLTED